MKRVRMTSTISESLHHRLNMYALAASAAGVGILTSAQSAEAKIVYRHAHRVINPGDSFKLDLNHDGVLDFTLKNYTYCNTDQCFFKLVEQPAAGNSVEGIGRGSFQPLASALSRGARIGRHGRFYGRTAILAYAYYGGGGSFASGRWVNVINGYLGMQFQIKGKTHYGWARLSVNVNKTLVTSTLTGYAYETNPNKPIIAGKTKGPDVAIEPASLGRLAQGASALSAWRE